MHRLILMLFVAASFFTANSSSAQNVWQGSAELGERDLFLTPGGNHGYWAVVRFQIDDFPPAEPGLHGTPFFGIMLRFDQATEDCVYLRSWRNNAPGQPTEIVFGKEEAGQAVKFAEVPLGFDWEPGVQYEWNVFVGPGRLTLSVAAVPETSGIEVLGHIAYQSAIPIEEFGLFVQDGTVVTFNSLEISPAMPVERASWGRIKSLY